MNDNYIEVTTNIYTWLQDRTQLPISYDTCLALGTCPIIVTNNLFDHTKLRLLVKLVYVKDLPQHAKLFYIGTTVDLFCNQVLTHLKQDQLQSQLGIFFELAKAIEAEFSDIDIIYTYKS